MGHSTATVNIQQTLNRGHDASPQSGLGVGFKRCSSSDAAGVYNPPPLALLYKGHFFLACVVSYIEVYPQLFDQASSEVRDHG